MKLAADSVKHKVSITGLALLATDGAFYGFTDPNAVSSPLLFAGLLLLSVNLFSFAYLAMRLLGKAGFVVGAHYRKAVLGGAGVTALLIALQSIGQLTTRDVVVLVPFAVIAYVYISYAQPEPHA